MKVKSESEVAQLCLTLRDPMDCSRPGSAIHGIFQFIVIHIVKGFGIVNEAEIHVFLELSCFFHDPEDVGNLISGSSAFSKTSLNIRKFTDHVLLKPGLENLSITLLACEMSASVLAWRIPGTGDPGGLPSMGSHRVGHD